MYTNTLHQFIAENFPAYAINLKAISQLNELAELVQFRRNEILFAEGKLINQVILVVQGNLMSYTTFNGTKKVQRFWFKQQTIFLGSHLSNQTPTKQTIVAINDCTLLIFSYNSLLKLIDEQPVLWEIINLLHLFEHKLLQAHIDELSLAPRSRYRFIMQQYPELIQLVTADLLASYLNMGYSTFARFRQSRS